MKKALSIALVMTLCVLMVSVAVLQVSAFNADGFKANIKEIHIGVPTTGEGGRKYLPVDVTISASEDIGDENIVYFLEAYLKATLKDGRTAESIAGLGMTLMRVIDTPTQSNTFSWKWNGESGTGVIKYNVPLLKDGEEQTIVTSQATGLEEVNALKEGDSITFQNETVLKEVPGVESVFSNEAKITIEAISNYPKTITIGDESQTEINLKAVKSTIYVGATTKVKAEVKNGVGTTTFESGNKKIATVDKNGKVTGKKAGETYIIAKNNNKTAKVKIKIIKRTNTVVTSVRIINAKHNKKTVVKKAIKVKNAKGKITFKKKSGDKKISINKRTGTLTVKKGLIKGKTYTVKVKVTDKGNAKYKSGSRIVKIKIKVK